MGFSPTSLVATWASALGVSRGHYRAKSHHFLFSLLKFSPALICLSDLVSFGAFSGYQVLAEIGGGTIIARKTHYNYN